MTSLRPQWDHLQLCREQVCEMTGFLKRSCENSPKRQRCLAWGPRWKEKDGLKLLPNMCLVALTEKLEWNREKEKLSRLLGSRLRGRSLMLLTSYRGEATLKAESMRSSWGACFQVIYNTGNTWLGWHTLSAKLWKASQSWWEEFWVCWHLKSTF